MAKFELKFLDCINDDEYIMVEREITNYATEHENEIFVDTIKIEMYFEGNYSILNLDKSTAIKFAKTLRTEINKIDDLCQ